MATTQIGTEQTASPADKPRPLPNGVRILQKIGVDFSHLSVIPPHVSGRSW